MEFYFMDHLHKILDDKLENGLKLNPKLTVNHTQLSSFSCMNVKLAAQILSATNANTLNNF